MSTRNRGTASHPAGAVHRRVPTPTKPWHVRVGFWLPTGIATFFLMTVSRAHLVAGVRWRPILLMLAGPLIHTRSPHARTRSPGRLRRARVTPSDRRLSRVSP